MQVKFKSNDLIVKKYRIIYLISKGFLGEVYKASDEIGRVIAIKILYKDRLKGVPEYQNYFFNINNLIKKITHHSISKPLDIGETDDYIYSVMEFYEGAISLEHIINFNAPLHPSHALSITNKISEALYNIHSNSLIHGDIKPSNILLLKLSPDSLLIDFEIRIIDFGMVQKVDINREILLLGTYNYLPPELKSTNQPQSGPYIDIFALGIITLEMLVGKLESPISLSRDKLRSLIIDKNQFIQKINQNNISSLINFIFKMTSIKSTDSDFSAFEILNILRPLKKSYELDEDSLFNIDKLNKIKIDEKIDSPQKAESMISSDSSSIFMVNTLEKLTDITESIAETTALFSKRELHLEKVVSPEDDKEILNEMGIVFTNALSRSKNSWRITVAMTITSFVLIICMILTAIIMGILTGDSYWPVIFGGASIPLILGTILWKPFDRMFRATILAQQLEMIHVQTISAFRGTSDINERMQICRDAISELGTLFEKHSKSDINQKQN